MADLKPAPQTSAATTPSTTTSSPTAQQQRTRGSRGGGFTPGQRSAGRRDAEEKQYDEQVLHIDRVARVVRGGRRFRFRALVVIGDHKNKVGVGSAKGADVTTAITKAVETAKKHLITLPLYKETIPHETEAKVGGAHILIKPASRGTGLISGGVVRAVLEVAGVHSALSKSLGSSNKTNTAYATIEALQKLVPAKDWVTTQKVVQKTERTKPTSQTKAKAGKI